VRLVAAFMLFILFMLLWYMFVDYAPSLARNMTSSSIGVYSEYLAAPKASTYWPWFIIVSIAVVAGYVAHRER